MRKRSHSYRPRLVGTPVTSALVAQFRAQATRCELAMRLGTADVDVYNEVADLLDMVGAMLIQRTPEHHADAIALHSAALTMIAAGRRRRDDHIPFSPTDANALQRGLDVIVRRVGELTTADIYRRMQQVTALRRSTQTATKEPQC